MEPINNNGSVNQHENTDADQTMCDDTKDTLVKQFCENVAKSFPPLDDQLLELVTYFTKNACSANNDHLVVQRALQRCKELFEKDYFVTTIVNKDGELSPNYPRELFIIENLKSEGAKPVEECMANSKMQELIRQGHKARARTRFPVPVLMYDNRMICRSSTLAFYGEIYGRKTVDYLFQGAESKSDGHLNDVIEANQSNDTWELIDKVQTADKMLLEHVGVTTIFDLMVEFKKYKYGIAVSSSEKNMTESKYHSDFKLISFPYPGCEFFKEFHNQNFTSEGLKFNWNQPMCDAELVPSEIPELPQIDTKWEDYKNWDLIEITKNYLEYILKHLKDNKGGILVHCISGWDRTPLFISMIRLSLWADGLVHASLNENEILYLTLAYDWMLFGHQLPNRISKHEDVLLFCYHFLKYIKSDDFSLVRPKKASPLMCVPEENPSNDVDMKVSEGHSTPSPVFHLSPQSSPPDQTESPSKARPSSSFSLLEDADSLNEPMNVNSQANTCGGLMPISIPVNQSSADWSFVSGTGSVRSDDSSSVSSHSSSEAAAIKRSARLSLVRKLFFKHYFNVMSSDINYVPDGGMLHHVYKTVLGYYPKAN